MTSSGFQINYAQVEACIQEMDNIYSDLIRTVSVVKGNSSGDTYEALEALSNEVDDAISQLRTMITDTKQYVKSTLDYHKTKDAQHSVQMSGKAGG